MAEIYLLLQPNVILSVQINPSVITCNPTKFHAKPFTLQTDGQAWQHTQPPCQRLKNMLMIFLVQVQLWQKYFAPQVRPNQVWTHDLQIMNSIFPCHWGARLGHWAFIDYSSVKDVHKGTQSISICSTIHEKYETFLYSHISPAFAPHNPIQNRNRKALKGGSIVQILESSVLGSNLGILLHIRILYW